MKATQERKYKEVRLIRSDSVGNMCIKEGYYTRGTNEEYCNLLCKMCDYNANTSLEDLEKIAADILEHSDWEKKAEEYGAPYDELVRIVMTNLLNECCYTIIEVEEEK